MKTILTRTYFVSAVLLATLALFVPTADAQVTQYPDYSYIYGSGIDPRYVNYPYNPVGYESNNYQTPVAEPFRFSTAPQTTAYVGVPFSYQPIAQSLYGAEPVIALENGPDGMYMDGFGNLVWIPEFSQAGQTFQVSLSARDRYSSARSFHNFFVSVALSAPTSVRNQNPVAQRSVESANYVEPARTSDSASVQTAPTYQAFPLFSLFGKKTASNLEISKILAQSGPVNLYDDVANTNCSVTVNWETNIESAGQVVYGTVSQPGDSFNYEKVAIESVSALKSHSVKLDCLKNQTYYFRVISFSQDQRAVSEEMVIFPFKVDGVLAGVGKSLIDSGSNNESGFASLFAIGGQFFVNPLMLLILLGVAIFLIVKFFGKSKIASVPIIETGYSEPELFIPTPPEVTQA